ncbi:MAG: hypothetical protein KC503_46425 [Myxococcales bacterium]|nr:hypothetical protein [Myxococcales bacterium]
MNTTRRDACPYRYRYLTLALLVASTFGTCGASCQGKSFSPVTRASSMGIAAPYAPGGGEVAGSFGLAMGGDEGGLFGGPAVGFLGDARVTIGVSPSLALEGSFAVMGVGNVDDENAYSNADRGWGITMVGLGARWLVSSEGVSRVALSAGFGVGCGGARGGKDLLVGGCGSDTFGRAAGGGYLGLDLGAQITRRFGIYANSRYQLAKATQLPLTHWGQHVVGLQWGRTLIFRVEGGVVHFHNEVNSLVGGTFVTALAIRWGLAR